MKEFHCIVGNNRGVGKSLVASLVMQYAEDQGWGPFGIECDQSNRTLQRLKLVREYIFAAPQQSLTRESLEALHVE